MKLRKASKLVGAVLAAALSLGVVVATQAPEAAEAATVTNTCHTGGLAAADASGYCWFDFTGLNTAGSTGTVTQPFVETIGNGFTMSFTVTISQQATSGTLPVWSAFPTPTWDSGLFSNGGKGMLPVAGSAAIEDQSTTNWTKGFDGGSGSATIGISNIKLLDPAGLELGGYSLALADAETSNQGETWQWTTNGNPWVPKNLIEPNSGDGACRGAADTIDLAGLTGVGTTSLTCVGSASSWGALAATTGGSPTQITAINTETSNGKQALAIGINTSTLTFKKSIASRAGAGDQFALNVLDGNSAQVGSAPVTTGTQTTTTTGALTVPVSDAYYGMSETISGGGSLSNYAQSWSCASATGGATAAAENLPAAGSSGTSKWITLPAVDQVTCTLTNTALSNPITLTKNWVNALAGSTAQLKISGTGVSGATSATSTAGTGPDPDTVNVATATGVVGASVTLSETQSGTAATYAPTYACTQAGTSWTSTGATFTMPASSGAINCTVTNTATNQAVQVNKTWIIKNASGTVLGTYNVPAQASDTAQAVPAGFTAAPTLTGQTSPAFGATYTSYVAGQAVTVGEGPVTVPSGCSLTSQKLTAANGTSLPTAASLPYAGTLTGASLATFTITNTVTCAQSLTLVDKVGFGTLPADSWTLNATAPTGDLIGPSGKTGAPGATAVQVTPGDPYGLSDSSSTAGAQNYAGTWVCTVGGASVPVTGGDVTVGYGQDVTCTLTLNTASVVVLKHIQGSGTLTSGQFNLTLTPPSGLGSTVTVVGSETASSANSFEVKPGASYSLAEQALSSKTAYLALGLQQSTDGGATWMSVSGNQFTPVAGTTVFYRFVNQAVPALMLPLTGGVGLDVIAYWSLGLLAAGGALLIWMLRRRARRA